MRINFINTLEEELLCNNLDKTTQKKSKAPTVFFYIILILISYLMYLGFGIYSAIVLFVIGVIYQIVIEKYLPDFTAKIIIKKQKKYLQNKNITLSDNALLINIGSSEFSEPLDRIENYLVYSDKIYIRMLDTDSLIIPKRAFESDSNQFSEFINIIKNRSQSKSPIEDINVIQKERLQKSFDILIHESFKSLAIIKYISIILLDIFAFLISIIVVGVLDLSGTPALIVPLVFLFIFIPLSPKIFHMLIPSISQSIRLNIFYEIQNNAVLKDDGIHTKKFGKDYFVSWHDIKVYRILVNNIFLKTNNNKLFPVYFNDNHEKENIMKYLTINKIKLGDKKDLDLKIILKKNK